MGCSDTTICIGDYPRRKKGEIFFQQGELSQPIFLDLFYTPIFTGRELTL